MLRILPRYVFREVGEAFLVALGGYVLLFFLLALLGAVHRDLPLNFVVRLLSYEVPYALTWTIPLAILTACVIAYGRLSADNEITAMRASGIHPSRIVYPAVAAGAILVALCSYLNAYVVPNCRLARKATLRDALLDAPMAMAGLEGTPIRLGPLQVFFRTMRDDRLYDVVVHSPSRDTSVEVIRAEEGRLSFDRAAATLTLTLWRGEVTWYDAGEAFGQTAMEFDEWQREVKLDKAGVHIVRGWRDTPTPELREFVRTGRFPLRTSAEATQMVPLSAEYRHEILVEVARRRAMSWAPLPFVLAGAPLGVVTRRGKKIIGFAASLLVILVFYPLLVAGDGLATRGVLPAWLALPACDVIVGIGGVVMTSLFIWKR